MEVNPWFWLLASVAIHADTSTQFVLCIQHSLWFGYNFSAKWFCQKDFGKCPLTNHFLSFRLSSLLIHSVSSWPSCFSRSLISSKYGSLVGCCGCCCFGEYVFCTSSVDGSFDSTQVVVGLCKLSRPTTSNSHLLIFYLTESVPPCAGVLAAAR